MPIDHPDDLRVALSEERLVVGTAAVKTDHVRVRTVVEDHLTSVEQELVFGQLDVARITVDYAVSAAPAPRQEGDTLVISLVEERLVVEKRLFVVEEVRVTRSARVEAVSIPVTLRRMRAVVERDDPISHRETE